jgi:hypothetical protein
MHHKWLSFKPIIRLRLSLLVMVFSLWHCGAPRSNTQSARLTPAGSFRTGLTYNLNIPTQTIEAVADNIQEAVDTFKSDTETAYDDNIKALSRSLLAYSLDPLTVPPISGGGMDLHLRYGVYPRFDAGYRYASGVHVVDARFQFLGSADPDPPSNSPGSSTYAHVGIQYSGQDYVLPSFLGSLQERLGYEASRTDILIPVTFGHPFGPHEKYGAIAYGIAYQFSKMNYGFNPSGLYRKIADGTEVDPLSPIPGIKAEKSISAFGGFVNLKFGYKYIYAHISLSVYYQDYGTFTLLDGDTTQLDGLTFVPTFGLEAQIPVFDY